MKNANNDHVKTQLFEHFYSVWEERYEKLKKALRYIETYPYLFNHPVLTKLINAGDLDHSHTIWLDLLLKFYHPDDIHFFKPWHVMILESYYQYYVDLSDEKLPVFYFDFTYTTHQWARTTVFESITEFMLIPDQQDIDIDGRIEWCRFQVFLEDTKNISPDDFGL